MLTLPDFREMEDSDLRRIIADLRFQRDVYQDFLTRAMAEAAHRRADAKSGEFYPRPADTDPKKH